MKRKHGSLISFNPNFEITFIKGNFPDSKKGMEIKMSKQPQMMNAAKYVVTGMVIGSAVGTAVSVMMRPKHHSHHHHGDLRSRASSTLDTVTSLMQNVADFVR